MGSSIPRASHAGAYTHAGPEIGVAFTKAFTAQVSVLTLWALGFADIQKGRLSKMNSGQLMTRIYCQERKHLHARSR